MYKRKKSCRFSKMNIQGREIFKRFLVDKLSWMTLVLDGSPFSKKFNFKNDEMRSHECSYFLFFIWNTTNQTFFLLYSSFMAPLLNMENEQFSIKQTWISTQKHRSLEQTNQRLIFTFQWKLHKQRCNCERMRDNNEKEKNIKFRVN